MEQREFDAMMEDWLLRQKQRQSSPNRENRWAAEAGITQGIAGSAFVTGDDVSRMLMRALEYFFARIVGMLQEE